jgi:hypothetical protein
MTADTIGAGDTRRAGKPDAAGRRLLIRGDMTRGDMTRGGIAASAMLHAIVLALVLLGLPNLFRKPPPRDMPIAVQLVTIAPETLATHPNPFQPRPEAKPEPPGARPAPIPEPKPEPPAPAPTPPPSPAAGAAPAPPLLPEPPKPEAKPTPEQAALPPPKPEPKPAPPAPSPPPKTVEARAPHVQPPVPEHKPRPKPDRPAVQHARAEPKPEANPKPEAKKVDPATFNKLLQDLETPERQEKKNQPDAFDSLLKNLAKQQSARTEEPKPAPRRMASLSPPSSQPKAPLGTVLTASDFDLVREKLRPCFHPPFGAKENPDLVADVRVAMSPDGLVQQARVVDAGRYTSDPVFRALADSGVRALRDPQCAPLPLPQDKYDQWKTFILGVSTKDME